MKKDYTDKIALLQKKCLTILDFMFDRVPTFEKYYLPIKEYLQTDIGNTKRVLNTVKDFFRDLKIVSEDLPPNDRVDLYNLLQITYGAGWEDSDIKEIEKIIARGKILNDDEFRLLDNHVDNLCQTSENNNDAIEVINSLLLSYMKTKK
jgi:hypothetical protein